MTAPTTPTSGTVNRRWRMLLILGSISIGWKVFVLTAGAALPHYFLDDGLKQVPAELVPYGTQAREIARDLWGGRIERMAVRKIRLVSVARVPGDETAAHCGGLNAHVRAYTYFALPYSEVHTVCDRGVVEYRVFRRSHGRP